MGIEPSSPSAMYSIFLYRISFFALSLIPGTGALGDKFSSGKFAWSDILLYGMYLVKMLLLAGGATAIISIILGGYHYLMPTEDAKEKGKDSLKNAFIGLAIVTLAWAGVDILITLLTTGS